GAASDYTLYSEGGFDVSLTRCAMEAFPGQHFVRLNQSQRSHVAHCYRNESPYPITRTWFTPRHQTRFFVVTDSSGDNLQTVIGSTTEHHTGKRGDHRVRVGESQQPTTLGCDCQALVHCVDPKHSGRPRGQFAGHAWRRPYNWSA
ncbi:hypothetical protein AB1L30_00240, partial [Bremerella sp. JC817]|uniref:hypothetical protein n=1 Tax=Bremerella sp. JC817 TaxID=3231756 RepID=UPI0034579A30